MNKKKFNFRVCFARDEMYNSVGFRFFFSSRLYPTTNNYEWKWSSELHDLLNWIHSEYDFPLILCHFRFLDFSYSCFGSCFVFWMFAPRKTFSHQIKRDVYVFHFCCFDYIQMLIRFMLREQTKTTIFGQFNHKAKERN